MTTTPSRKSISQLVTHDGEFHADEVFSTIILRALYPDAEIIRTRCPEIASPATGRIVYDVGGVFDPDSDAFDHHQRGAPNRADGTPYSSFGMVWARFGRDWAERNGCTAEIADALWAKVDADFVRLIDATDTGAISPGEAGLFAQHTLPYLIESMNPPFDAASQNAPREAFDMALSISASIFSSTVEKMMAEMRAEAVVRKAIVAAGDGQVLELPAWMPYDQAILDLGAENLLYVTYPSRGEWQISAVRDDPAVYVNRKDMPESWGGLTGSDLEAATGVEGAVFCHKALFFAVAKTREAALEMTRLSVEHDPEPQGLSM